MGTALNSSWRHVIVMVTLKCPGSGFLSEQNVCRPGASNSKHRHIVAPSDFLIEWDGFRLRCIG